MTLARVRSLIVIGVLAVLAVTTVTWAIAKDGQPDSASELCRPKTSGVLPPPAKVKVRVLNATGREGLARQVADELKKAGFDVVGNGNERDHSVESAAEIRYGTKALSGAALVRGYVRNSVPVPDEREKELADVVDLILGDSFEEVGVTKPDEVQQVLKEQGPLVDEPDPSCADAI